MADQEDFSGDDSWETWAQRQQMDADDAAMSERIRAGQEIFGGYAQLRDQAMAEQRQKNERAALHLLSGFKLAAMNGSGTVPNYALVGMNDALGYNGKNGALQAAVINPKDGSFGLVVQDGNGNVTTKPFTFAQMYNIALENPGVFTRDELRYLRDGSIRTRKLTPDMANRDLPPVPDNYGEARTPVGEKTPTGGTSVNPHWLFPQQRARISAFGANGRGGFTRYYSGEETGHQLVRQDFGTRANELSGLSEKERIARINADGKVKAAEKASEAKMSLANAANELKKYGIDVSAQLKERGLDIQQQDADERSAHNQAIEEQNAENEKGRNDRAKQANELKAQIAELKGKGTIGGRPPTVHEYIEAMKFANDPMNNENDRNQVRAFGTTIREALEKRGEKVPEIKQGGSGKKPVAYQYTKDRKKRRAVYSDGTKGEPEEVK